MFQCYCEETIDDRFLDFSIFKENSETKYTDHCLQLKLKKKKDQIPIQQQKRNDSMRSVLEQGHSIIYITVQPL